MILPLLAVLLLMAAPVQATTYYVAKTGTDANGGTSDSPFLTIKKCAQTVVPGDTCLIRDGTYTPSDQVPARTDISIYLSAGQGIGAGTSTSPITLKSENPLGATIQIPSVNAGSAGINVSQPFWIIEGFRITGAGVTQSTGASASQAGITISANNTTVRRNTISDVATGMCNGTALGQSAILINNNIQNTLIEANKFDRIGRLKQIEGCAFDMYHHDHGVYDAGGDFTTIQRNVFSRIDRGYAVHIYASGSIHDNITVVHNTFDNGSPDARVGGTLIACNTLTNITIDNNIFRNPANGYAVEWCSGTTASNFALKNNSTNVAGTDMLNPSLKPSTGITTSGNLFSQALGLTNTTAGSEDFRLTSSSAAINAGLNLGNPYCGSAPDIGAFETCGTLSASINGSTLEITMASIFPPVQPNSAGVSLTCTGPGCGAAAAGSVTLKGGTDAIVSIAVTGLPGGVCSAGDTYTVTCSTCGWTDSSKIGGTANQSVLSFTALAVTNTCAGSGPAYPPSPYVYYPLDGNVQDASGNARDAVQSGGTFAAAKYNLGFSTTNGSNDSFTIPYGNGVNLGTQSLTLAFGVYVKPENTGLTRNVMGTAAGVNQRLYILSRQGAWGVQVQEDGATWALSDLSVDPGWNLLVLRIDAATNTATLCKNGVMGTTGSAVNTYTDHTLPSHLVMGLPPGFATSTTSTSIYDEVRLWTSLQSCADIWAAWEPPSSQFGTHEQKGHRFQSVYLLSGSPVNLGTSINQSQPVIQSGGVAVVFQVDCQNVSPCDAASYELRHSLDGITYVVTPDTPTSDGVYLWGESADAGLNRFGTTCPLTGALSCTDGGTVLSSHATTAVNLAQNSSRTLRFLVRITNPPSSNVYLKLFHANGNALAGGATPSTGAQIVVIPPQASAP